MIHCNCVYVFSGNSSLLMDVAMVTDPELILSDHLTYRVSKNVDKLSICN